MSLDLAQAEAVGGAQVIAPSLQNNQKQYRHGNLQFNTLQSNNFSTGNTLGGSLSQSTINIGPDVNNFSKSFLNCLVTLPAPAAGQYIYTMADVLAEIQHIQLYPSTSTNFIVDIDNVPQYWKSVVKQETSLKDYQTFDRMNKLYPNNSLNNVMPALRSGTVVGGPLVANVPSSLSYTEPTYFEVGNVASAVTYQLYIPLAMFKNSFFSMDQLVYFGQTVFMKIYWNQLSKIAFVTTSDAAPNVSAAVAYNPANPTISNLNLYLATEQVEEFRKEVMTKTSVGYSMLIPYVQNFSVSATGSRQSITNQLDIGMGRVLQKMYWMVNSTLGDGLLSYDISNNNGSKVIQYYTMLNNKREQQINLGCTAALGYTDYLQQKDRLKGSVCQNHDIFQYNWAHCSDYTGFTSEYVQEGRTDLISGVPMSGVPLTWTFFGLEMAGGVNVNYIHYGFGIFVKELKITGTDIFVI